VDGASVPRLPRELVLPAGLFALALALDLLHYIVGAATWGIFHRYHEVRLADPKEDPETTHPSWLEYPILSLFLLKLMCVGTAYVFVTLHIVRVWLKN
jgi:hypothetical protein